MPPLAEYGCAALCSAREWHPRSSTSITWHDPCFDDRIDVYPHFLDCVPRPCLVSEHPSVLVSEHPFVLV